MDTTRLFRVTVKVKCHDVVHTVRETVASLNAARTVAERATARWPNGTLLSVVTQSRRYG